MLRLLWVIRFSGPRVNLFGLGMVLVQKKLLRFLPKRFYLGTSLLMGTLSRVRGFNAMQAFNNVAQFVDISSSGGLD